MHVLCFHHKQLLELKGSLGMETEQGIERRYKVLMRAVALTDPSGDGRWICPHPTKKMDKVYVNIDIFCKLLKEHVAEKGGEIGCEDLPRY